MKKIAAVVFASLICWGCFAQGLVKFSNNVTTLISGFGPYYPTGPIPIGAGPYYYGLLTAPLGTVDPLAFTFAGIYATNTAATTGGRLQGGSNLGVSVVGWAPGESRSFEVMGWSGNLGPTFNPAWLTSFPQVYDGWFGISPIGQGIAGGTDSNGSPIPAMAVFGAAPSISTGFVIGWIPEPSSIMLVGLGVLAVFIQRSRK